MPIRSCEAIRALFGGRDEVDFVARSAYSDKQLCQRLGPWLNPSHRTWHRARSSIIARRGLVSSRSRRRSRSRRSTISRLPIHLASPRPVSQSPRDPASVAELTIRQNLVAVVTNGTAVLGLGNIGPLAAKPVMEGKAVLFKKFAGIDVFDIEIAENDVDRLVDVIAALEPTFGGINLEDIKAPECFEVERKLRERMSIPVFHDDQHGTAIIVGAAIVNAMELAGKSIGNAKIVTSGAGAAALACLDLLVDLGAKRENIFVTDIEGVVYKGRTISMNARKEIYARDTNARTLADVIGGADVFLGLSAGGVLRPEMVKQMGETPLIMALANPAPEIEPDAALAARPDAMICTGRSDYPNQVNNVLCFPYMFRGALDVAASTINEAMKLAAVRAIAQLAHEPPSDVVAKAYGGRGASIWQRQSHSFAFRSAPDPAHRAGRRQGGNGDAASRKSRSPISSPMKRRCRASCSVPASS